MWESVPVGGPRNTVKLGEDEVSIITSRNKKSIIYRINFRPTILKDETLKRITLNVDTKRKRLGFFEAKDGFDRKLIPYNKRETLVYVSFPKAIAELGFKKGRYKIHKPKDQNNKMYFFIKAEEREGDKED